MHYAMHLKYSLITKFLYNPSSFAKQLFEPFVTINCLLLAKGVFLSAAARLIEVPPGEITRLVSPRYAPVDTGENTTCVTFSYTLYGQSIGTLTLYMYTALNRRTALWEEFGTSLSSLSKHVTVRFSSNVSIWLEFHATRGYALSDRIGVEAVNVDECRKTGLD